MPALTLKDRLDAYERLMRLDRPIGILLLLWPTLWAIWLAAPGQVRADVLAIFILGTILMRSAGCIVNDLADRHIDPHVERTRSRPLAAGIVQPAEALALCAVLLLLAFLLVLQLNRLAIQLSFLAVAITAIYPFLKRFFALPQAGLGIAFSFGIPMAFAAQLGRIPSLAWALMAATFFWIVAYDTEYAMVDRDDDVRIGVRSSAITLGRFDVAAVMTCQGAFLAAMAAIGWWQNLGVLYFGCLAVAAAFAAVQWRMIRHRQGDGCFKAFLSNNWVGAVIFAGIALDRLFGVRVFG